MAPSNTKETFAKYIRVVVIFQLLVVLGLALYSYFFWHLICGDNYKTCLADGIVMKPTTFILLSILRPFVFTPHIFMSYLAGQTFSPIVATLLTAIGSTLSYTVMYGIGRLISQKFSINWMKANIPETLRLFQYHDFKIVLATRLFIFFPFDLMSFAYGFFHFRFRRALICTFIGILPEAYFISTLSSFELSIFGSTVSTMTVFALATSLPLIGYEYLIRKRGSSLWTMLKAVYDEFIYEVKINNEIVKRYTFDPRKTPVLLIYGFFSSRRTLSVIEKHLVSQGFDVLSFNLGGLLGTFFTSSISDTAAFLDYKIKRQIERHGFKNIHIVAHSKGGLVALYWLLKLGGSKYCDKVITLGTPYAGSFHTYLAIPTPLGIFWRDVWQMRPGSSFLRYLRDSEVPENLKIVCLYSKNDSVSRGKRAIFRPLKPSPNVESMEIPNAAHYDFLFKRSIIQKVIDLLRTDHDKEVIQQVSGATAELLKTETLKKVVS